MNKDAIRSEIEATTHYSSQLPVGRQCFLFHTQQFSTTILLVKGQGLQKMTSSKPGGDPPPETFPEITSFNMLYILQCKKHCNLYFDGD